jgi:hypothetical protein
MRPLAESPYPFTITIDVHKVPTAAPQEIAKQLEETEMGYRFFRDATTGRGNVVYRRYDATSGCSRLQKAKPATCLANRRRN